MESQSSSQNAINDESTEWDEQNFSRSVNEILKEVQQSPDGVDIFSLLNIVNDKHPEYGSVDPKYFLRPKDKRGLKFLNLVIFLKVNKKYLDGKKRTAREYAKLVLEITRVPSPLNIITGRLFLLALIYSINVFGFRDEENFAQGSRK